MLRHLTAAMLLLGPGVLCAEVLPQTETVQELSVLSYNDAEVLAMAQTLDAKEVKYLCYLMARLNRMGAAEDLAELVLAETPEDKNTLLAMASMYIELQEKEKALRTSERLLKSYPNDDQALYFTAAAYYQAGMYQAANDLFAEIKTRFYDDELYPYEIDLAASADRAGDWYRSMQSYQTLLREHNLNDQLRQPVRDALDNIYRERMDRLELTPEFAFQDNGWTLVAGADVSRQITDRVRLGMYGEGQTTHLDARDGIRAGNAQRGEAGAWTEFDMTKQWSWQAELGGSTGEGTHVLAGASTRYYFDPLLSVEVGVDFGEAARDTLALEFIDGRQDRVFIRVEDTWDDTWPVSLGFSARQVRVNDDIDLGNGLNAIWSFGKRLRLADPEIIVRYVGYWQGFSRDTFNPQGVAPLVSPITPLADQAAIWDNLVSTNINNQGLNVQVTDRFWRAWRYELNAAVFYSFSREAMEFAGGGRLVYYPRKSIEVFTGLTYYSSTLTNNSGNYRIELNSGLRCWF
ncbi:tetratricopeptide repeat protein [Cerasicoccus fimbriatus]|uniref:tetratricopeptide repeat protein n=1 Tax=Cerasicoccus fimbriatus TaxID=3014554 RepID=UPI0022B2D5A6|nr:tetratricopeptide repeat protein [Cerasicoccus sp. TK19100]